MAPGPSASNESALRMSVHRLGDLYAVPMLCENALRSRLGRHHWFCLAGLEKINFPEHIPAKCRSAGNQNSENRKASDIWLMACGSWRADRSWHGLLRLPD
jgi:hypothetical protein